MKRRSLLLLLSALFLLSCGENPDESSAVSSQISSEFVSSSQEETSVFSSEEPPSSDTFFSSEASSSSSHESSFDPSSLYDGYYDAIVSWENGEDLKKQLHDVISSGTYRPLAYAPSSGSNWESSQDADQDLLDFAFVDPVYTEKSILKEKTNLLWQREHAFCASLMCGSATQDAVATLGRATDFHNLFAGESSANSSRGNKNFGFADKTSPGYVDRTVSGGKDGYSFDPKTFEPGDQDKGRLSRAIFYMATMYSEEVYDARNGVTMQGLSVVEGDVPYVAGDSCAFSIGHLSDLLSWSAFPVDALEYQHNESVYSYTPSFADAPQGNRNPYVDFPGLVDYVFGNKKNMPGTLSDVVSSYESLAMASDDIASYAIKSAKRHYDLDEAFSFSDLEVVALTHSRLATPFDGFQIEGASEGNPFTASKTYKVTVITPLNRIVYEVDVGDDPIAKADWSYTFKGKTGGGELNGISNAPGVDHELSLNGVDFLLNYSTGAVGNNSKTHGVAFGTSANPTKKLTIQSKQAFACDAKERVYGIYLRGSCASGKTAKVSFYIGDTLVHFGMLSYLRDAPVDVGFFRADGMKGLVKLLIENNESGAIYVQSIAVYVVK